MASLLCGKFLFLLLLATSSAAPVTIPSFSVQGDPPYNVSTADMQKALVCPNGIPDSTENPVLLVHGTGSTGDESWGKGYVPALLKAGHKACYLNLPNRSMNDAQISSSYVAYNLHYLSSLTGTSVSAIGHSQGSPNIQWALRFFPSTRDPAVTRSFVALSPDFSGVGFYGLTGFCDIVSGVPLCAPSIWQQTKGSNYMAALSGGSHGIDQAYVPTTVVWSETDEIVIPAFQNSRLSGASVVSAQDLCPGRAVGHLLMTHDAAGFAIALDALTHEGEADVSRIDRAACTKLIAPGMDPTLLSLTEAALNDVIKGILLGGTKTTQEPALMQYAV